MSLHIGDIVYSMDMPVAHVGSIPFAQQTLFTCLFSQVRMPIMSSRRLPIIMLLDGFLVSVGGSPISASETSLGLLGQAFARHSGV